ncbi:GNAT family N-acetyltransferase [Bacillus cereus]|uniref:GNAT family N-acetyltransferase n=1 Tax=Bacillus cereus TaxID=1396 RepID=UPI001E29E75F|nr:GNAT family N-acetyltransferase [Bacillus cereus]MDA2704882.1 GNAT family N-acetyltransferase [Bacillus cereus]
MTHPDYRHQGLATKLMNHIIKKYEKDYDFIYLFANDTVLEFYPKFGFEKVQESSFSLKVSNMICQIDKKYDLRKLDVNNQADFELMKKYEAERIPVSSRLGLKNSNIIHFNMLIIFCCLVS